MAARLVYIQIGRFADLSARAARQQSRTIEVSPRRGVVYDRNFRELAMSAQVDSIFAAPSEFHSTEAAETLLSRVLDLDQEGRRLLRKQLTSGKTFAWVKRKVASEEAARVTALNLRGVYLQKESKRFYPKGLLAAHLLGYVSVDENGQAGVELELDRQIKGQAGRMFVQTDGRRKHFSRMDDASFEPGADVALTIDEQIQYIAETELDEVFTRTHALAGTVIVMDPNNGDILALANRPAFDPNTHLETDPAVWVNRAIGSVYEPGSTMKVITVAAALEEKLTTPDEVIDCQMGSINVFGRIVRDHKPFGYLSVNQIMANSSDVGVIKLGLRLGNERMHRYMRRFGLGGRTGVDLPGEEKGILRTPDRWTKSSMGSIAMGQEVGATALQMATAISAVANGGILPRPRVVRDVFHGAPKDGRNPGIVMAGNQGRRPGAGQRVISEETAAILRNMMEQVVMEGTAKSARLKGYSAAGKTGTAQKYDPRIGTYSKTDHVASFIGFAPVNNPTIAVAVIVDSPIGDHHGGTIAAPIFKRIAEKALAYLEAPHDLPVSTPLMAATRSAAPHAPPVAGAGSPLQQVTARVPDFGNATVVPLAGAPQAPDFIGRPLRAVVQQAMRAGVEVELQGHGVARQQSPAPGANLLPGQKIVVRFSQ